MELIRGVHNLRPRHRGCALTIGNFDGVHLGHRAVLAQLREHAERAGVPGLVVIFEPQPQEHFQPNAPQPRLTRLREKVVLLAGAGVERVLCVRFDAELAAQPAETFVASLLVDALGARVIVVGDDFHFGKGRGGNFGTLERMAPTHGFMVVRAATFDVDGERVSSTRIRQALAKGELDYARRLLGRYYSICGRVVHGNRNGRKIGFPTANIELHRRQVALRGIFAARVHDLTLEPLLGVAYIGSRPVIRGTRDILEVHILDFDGDCYGRNVRVEFISQLRGDVPFVTFEALRAQLAVDARHARETLAAVECD